MTTRITLALTILCCLGSLSRATAGVISNIAQPGDFIIPIDLDGTSNTPGAEQAFNAIDNSIATKYLNFGEQNSGFIITPSNNPGNYYLNSLTITTANDTPDRDPASFAIYGTNDLITSLAHSDASNENWTFIASGLISLPLTRLTVGPTLTFENFIHYNSFLVVFPTVRNAAGANSMQLAEIALGAATPEPSTLALTLCGLMAVGCMARKRRPQA